MPRQSRPWPLQEMLEWYKSGMTTGEIAALLSSDAWQEYWTSRTGGTFRPHKVSVAVVLGKSGCQMRSRSVRMTGRHPATKPWPIQEMIALYNGGMSLEELSEKLSSDEYQIYWKEKTGSEYRPGQKIVNKVLKKHVRLRTRGAKGHRNGSWNGGIRVDDSGYRLVHCPDHPFAASNGCVREHRLIAEKMIGRYLRQSEVVHHKDGNTGNNNPDNLEVFESNAIHLSKTTAGCHRPMVSVNNLRRLAMRKNRTLLHQYDCMIRSMNQNGLTIRQIGELLDCHDTTVSANLARLGCSRKPLKKGVVPEHLREECRRFLATLDQSIRDGRA